MSIISERIIASRKRKIEARKKALQDDLQKATDILINHYQVTRIILFGSMARGKIRPGSDIDLIVEGLGDRFLEALCHCRRECRADVDIKPIEGLEPWLKKLAMKNGRVVYESGK